MQLNCYTTVKKPPMKTEENNHYIILKPKEPEKRPDTIEVSNIRYAPETDSKIMLQYYFYYQPENSREVRITSLTRITFNGSFNRYLIENKIFRLQERDYLSIQSLEEIQDQFQRVDFVNTPQYLSPSLGHWPVTNSGLVLSYREKAGDKFKHLYLEEPLDARYNKNGFESLLSKLMELVKEPRYKRRYQY